MLFNPWLSFSLMFLIAWLIIFLLNKKLRKEMFFVSLLTMPFGLTEPLFVPEYWLPDSLFNLALKTGFDIESFIFSFAIGGIGSVIYEYFFRTKHRKMTGHEKHSKKHKYHLVSLISPIIVFLILFFFTSLNPIYTASISMLIGGISALFCRPDLKKKIFVSGFLFLVLYFAFFFLFILAYPNVVEKFWNLKAISGILVLGIPIEELIFAFTFGMLWGSYYEHLKWYKENS